MLMMRGKEEVLSPNFSFSVSVYMYILCTSIYSCGQIPSGFSYLWYKDINGGIDLLMENTFRYLPTSSA